MHNNMHILSAALPSQAASTSLAGSCRGVGSSTRTRHARPCMARAQSRPGGYRSMDEGDGPGGWWPWTGRATTTSQHAGWGRAGARTPSGHQHACPRVALAGMRTQVHTLAAHTMKDALSKCCPLPAATPAPTEATPPALSSFGGPDRPSGAGGRVTEVEAPGVCMRCGSTLFPLIWG